MKIDKVFNIEGDASVTVIRGKKRYLYDYTIHMNWVLSMPGKFSSNKSNASSRLTSTTPSPSLFTDSQYIYI